MSLATHDLENFETAVFKVPGRTDGAKGFTSLRLDLDRITEMIAVTLEPQDEWLGEISHEQWARWSDADRKEVLSDMLTWTPCERGDRKVPNDQGALAALVNFARLAASA